MKRLMAVMLLLLVAGMAYATPQNSRAESSMPAATSTSGARPHAFLSAPAAHPLAQTTGPVFYGAPYHALQMPDYTPGLPNPSISAAVNQWWAAYKVYWAYAFPGCYYTTASYSPDPANGGLELGLTLHGTCGGGQGFYGTPYSSYDPHKNNGCSGGCNVGDPINAATGNEYEDQEDYSVAGSLSFDRSYNSSPSVASTHIGANWRDNFDRSIEYLAGGTTPTATVYRPDGNQVVFQKINGVWTPDPDINDTLIENDNTQGQLLGWTFFDAANQQIEGYNALGQLTTIQGLNGQVTTLSYSNAATPPSVAPAPGLLLTVTGPRGRQLQFTYDVASQIVQIVLPDGGKLAYAYDPSGNLTEVTYPDGHTRVYKYDESSNAPSGFPHLLTGIIDANGQRYADIHYDSQGRAISSQRGGVSDLTEVAYNSGGTASVTWPSGIQTTMGFASPYGRMQVISVSQACAPGCNQTAASRTYDANGNPASSTDFNGVTTAYTYDADGLETQRIEAQGTPVQRTINTIWDTVFRNPLEQTVLDASGKLTAKTDWVYNVRGQVVARCKDDPTVPGATGYACSTSSTPPLGVRRWVYTYCNAVGGQCPLVGLLLSVEGPRTDVDQVTRYAYYTTTDESGCGASGGACHRAGDLQSITNALGQVTQFASYDKDGRVTESIDPNGVRTDFTYTPRGLLHTRTVAGTTTMIDYDAVGDVIKVVQPDGVFTTYAYDAAHRLISIGDALGDNIDFTLNEAGDRVAEKIYAAGSSTPSRSLSHVYNTLGQLVKSLDAYSNATTYAYDADGNRIDTTNALGVRMHQSYDALNRLSQTVRNYLGNDAATADTTSTFDHNSLNNLIQVTDPTGLDTDYTYNGFNNLTELLSPDTGAAHYTYDAAGNRISKTDARGVITRYTYDALNRLTSISYPKAALDVSFYYDQGNGTTGCAVSYPIGRLTRIVDASGSTTYCYDAHGMVISKRIMLARFPLASRMVAYRYDAARRLMGVGYPNGASVSYTRNAAGRIVAVTEQTSRGTIKPIVTGIAYLPFGPATQYQYADGGQVLNKVYNANYQAIGVEGTALNLHFKLNAIGDITDEGNAPGVSTPNESFDYNPLGWLTQVDGPTGSAWQSYTYNKTGDRLTKATVGQFPEDVYHYEPDTHRLIRITGYHASKRAMDADGNTTAFQARGWMFGLGYNDANRLALVQRDRKTIARYRYNGLGERTLKEVVGGGNRMYAYNQAGRLLGEYAVRRRAGRDYVWVNGTLVATLDGQFGGRVHYVYTDQLGTPRAVTTTRGRVVWVWSYNRNPFGERAASGNGYQLNLRFPGQYHDRVTGLNYNHFRDYEPSTGRYIESDPMGLAGGLSTYAYAGGDPLSGVDPYGLWTFQIGFSFSYNLKIPFTPFGIAGTAGVGAAFDSTGQIAPYYYYGGGPAAGTFGADGGVQLAVSDGNTVQDLAGPFSNYSVNGGDGAGGNIEGFSGKDSTGCHTVRGGGITIGGGGGAFAFSGITKTVVGPAGRLW